MIEIPLNFRTQQQEDYFKIRKRNSCFSGGFGSGKTYVNCQKVLYLLTTFPKYRVMIGRFEESKLRETTMKTFFSEICPPALYDSNFGGNRSDSMNKCTLINGSEVIFMHLKDTDEGIVRGLNINTVFLDQAEEVSEYMYLMLSARVGRWANAEVPKELLAQNPNWPIAEHTRKPAVPNYLLLACNPDSELHWIYRRYHPESEDWQAKFYKNHEMVEAETTTATVSPELLEEMMQNDEGWVRRYIKGKWGIPGGQIHMLPDMCVIKPNPDFLNTIRQRGNLARVLDHGGTAPTCCIWFSAYKQWYFAYREYYQPDKLVSYHREQIAELSGEERYTSGSLADPSIFKYSQQKYGGKWNVALEYGDKRIDAPVINWVPADNNEFATRNRISELLKPVRGVTHPLTGETPAPRLYIVERTEQYPQGCYYLQKQIRAQKRERVGTVNGKEIFSDERDDSVEDHAYDPLRYYCATHAASPSPKHPKAPAGSFFDVRKQYIAMRKSGAYQGYGIRQYT